MFKLVLILLEENKRLRGKTKELKIWHKNKLDEEISHWLSMLTIKRVGIVGFVGFFLGRITA